MREQHQQDTEEINMNPLFSTIAPTYTPTGGSTNQGLQLQQLTNLLSKITSAPPTSYSPSQLQQPYSQALGQATATQGGANQFAQGDINRLLSQMGVPGLMSSYGNLGDQFKLWLADKGFSGQFGNQSPTANLNPYANPQLQTASAQGGQALSAQNAADMAKAGGMTTPNQPVPLAAPGPAQSTPISGEATSNPFLGSTQSVIDSASNLPTPPSLVTGAMGAQYGGATNMLNLLSSLIGSEQNVAGQANQMDVAGYQDKMNALTTIANALGGALSTSQTLAQNPGSVVGSTAQAGSVFDNIINQVQTENNGNGTEKDVWDYINQHDSALRAQGVNVDELWRLHKDLASKVGQGGSIAGGTKAPKGSQLKTLYKGTPYETDVNYDPTTGKLYDLNTGQPVKYSSATEKSIETTLSNIDSIWNTYEKMSPFEQHLPDQIVNAVPALAPNRSALNTQFYVGLEGDLRKAIVGGRITQQEISWLKNAIIPTATDSDESAKKKLDAVKKALQEKLSNPSMDLTQTQLPGSGGATGNSKDPLGIL